MKTSIPSCSRRRVAVALALSACAFTAGWVSANLLYATEVNKGLVTAFNSVGQNLFGSAVFNVIPPNPIIPGNPVRLFVANNSRIPVAFDVFIPPNPITPTDPCRVVAQLSVGAEGAVRLAYDSSAFPDGIAIDEDTNLAQLQPNVARCNTAVPSPGGDF
jgi:hypothetical protein